MSDPYSPGGEPQWGQPPPAPPPPPPPSAEAPPAWPPSYPEQSYPGHGYPPAAPTELGQPQWGAPPPAYPAPGYPDPAYGQPQGYGQPAYPQPGYAGYPGASSQRNGKGLWAMILGIIAILIFWVPFLYLITSVPMSIIAIVLGTQGRGLARRGAASNPGQALAGIITGSIAAVLCVLNAIAGIILAT